MKILSFSSKPFFLFEFFVFSRVRWVYLVGPPALPRILFTGCLHPPQNGTTHSPATPLNPKPAQTLKQLVLGFFGGFGLWSKKGWWFRGFWGSKFNLHRGDVCQ